MTNIRPGEKQAEVWISEDALDRWKQYIRQKYAIPEAYGRYESVEADAAIVAFLDHDPASEAEAIVRAIDEALTHSSERYAERRTSDQQEVIREIDADRGPTEKFRPTVSAKRYAQLKAFVADVNEASDLRKLKLGEAFEVAMRERRLGGRKKRIVDRGTDILDALDADVDAPTDAPEIAVEVEDAEDVEDETPEFEHPPNTEAGKLERIRAYVADCENKQVEDLYRADGQIPKQHVIDAINEYCTRTRDTANDRTRQKYLDLIEQDLGLVEHPSGVLYDLVAPETLEQPAFEYKDTEQLDRSERAERVAVEALQRSRKQYGRSVSADDIPRLFRGVDIEDAEAGKIRDAAGDIDGIAVKDLKSGKAVVATDFDAVEDALLRSAGMADTDADADAADPADADTETDANAADVDGTDDTDDTDPADTDAEAADVDQETSDDDADRAEHEREAADRLDELTRATVVTDGGRRGAD